ncbi:hypothetical protein [Streptomyces sp. NPDC093598]|uniref:hypothetical protein n=1 Tax=Streptomyces sp. NPDC093598 TaxID=3366046 RepID=UPI0037FE3340
MTEAWGAVIAGIAAALGAAIGSWATARAAVKQALTQGREQQRNWLLDQRLAAYTEMLVAYDSIREGLTRLVEAQADPFHDAGDPPTMDMLQATGRLHESREVLARALQRIDLVGPRSIMRPAVEAVTQAVEEVFRARIGYSPTDHSAEERTEWHRAVGEFNAAQILFVDLANEALHSNEL